MPLSSESGGYHFVSIAHSISSLFVCFGFIVPLKFFSVIWRRHPYRWRAAKFDLCPALVAIEQWGFFSVPHLLWHGASLYNGHLQGLKFYISFHKVCSHQIKNGGYSIFFSITSNRMKLNECGSKCIWE